MSDKGKILAGSLVFFALVLSPLWYNRVSGQADNRPQPDLTPARTVSRVLYGKEICIRPAAVMRKQHAQILMAWRDQVVREGVREMVDDQGRHFRMSLTEGCMVCHSNKTEFCDRCHLSAGVTPKCFDCHQETTNDPMTRFKMTIKDGHSLPPGGEQ